MVYETFTFCPRNTGPGSAPSVITLYQKPRGSAVKSSGMGMSSAALDVFGKDRTDAAAAAADLASTSLLFVISPFSANTLMLSKLLLLSVAANPDALYMHDAIIIMHNIMLLPDMERTIFSKFLPSDLF
mmetsp:Transcript_1500/g.2005  ORF Transcript_1500/g.2005 Transcript_1500/m.2005 type:complete len:129 (+) Transcript_1500:256-642(+)